MLTSIVALTLAVAAPPARRRVPLPRVSSAVRC